MQHLITLQTNAISNSRTDLKRPREEIGDTETKIPDVMSLPQLSDLDRRSNPIREVWSIWQEGSNGGGKPLKAVMEDAKKGKKFSDRKTREIACKIKSVCVALELLMLDGVSEEQAFSRLHEAGESLDHLSKRISADLARCGLTKKGVTTTASNIHAMDSYAAADLFWNTSL